MGATAGAREALVARRWAVLACSIAVGCSCNAPGSAARIAPITPARAVSPAPASLRYALAVDHTRVTVTMDATNVGPSFSLPWAGTDAATNAGVMSLREADAAPTRALRALDSKAAEWQLPECGAGCRVTYSLDGSALLRMRAFDEGVGTPKAVLTTVRMLLAEPSEYAGDVEVRWNGTPSFRSGLSREDGSASARFDARAWDESTFAALGEAKCDAAPRANVQCCVIGDLRMANDAFARAFARAEKGVTQFYGRVAAPSLAVFAVAVPRSREIVFGKVRALGGPSIAFFVGDKFDKPEDDWVMVHELLHLGFPTIFEARWFSEGIATVFEPLIRHRMGDLDEARVWKGFADNLPRGLPALNTAGAVAASEDIDAMYWASSALMFEWEHTLREKSHGRFGVEDALSKLAKSYDGAPSVHLTTLGEVVSKLDALTEVAALGPQIAALATNRRRQIPDLLGPFGLDERGRIVDISPKARAARARFLRREGG